jgi:phospholipase/carboxylesterase
MLVHGDADDVVPVEAVFDATAAMQTAEIPLQWVVGPHLLHNVDPEGIAYGGPFLCEVPGS